MSLALGCTRCDVTPAGVTELSAPQAQNAYDALNPKDRRRAPSGTTMHEDRHLGPSQRRQMIGGHRDLHRNSSLLAWMVRQHLNYVCEHRFQSRTGDDDLDDEVEAAMKIEFTAGRLDEREIFDLDEYVRFAEAQAVLEGDCGTLFVDADGGRIQGIEGDRIRDPDGTNSYGLALQPNAENWYNGVRTTPSGRPIEYAVHRRVDGWTSFELERRVPAANFHLHAYRTRFDQARGVAPIVTAYNQIRDIYEAEDYALVRSKVASLFALKIKRRALASGGDVSYDTNEDGNPILSSYHVDFGRGPVFMDMEPGDDAEFMDSDNPGGNLQSFWRFVTLVALKALDLPYGLFDESVANFFGNKTAWLSYDRSCDPKRKRVRGLLDRITAFKLGQMIRSRRITLPKTMTLADVPWQWIPRGMPWWRPLEEVTASLKACGAAFTTPQRVCAETDQGDWYANVDEIGKAIDYAKRKGVPLSFAVETDVTKLLADARTKAPTAADEQNSDAGDNPPAKTRSEDPA